jgi:hypothetical protein
VGTAAAGSSVVSGGVESCGPPDFDSKSKSV